MFTKYPEYCSTPLRHIVEWFALLCTAPGKQLLSEKKLPAPRDDNLGWMHKLLTLFFCYPLCSARGPLLDARMPEVANRVTSLMTAECRNWLEQIAALDLSGPMNLDDEELNNLLHESNAALFVGDAVDHARNRVEGFCAAERHFWESCGGSCPADEWDQFMRKRLAGRVETLDLLLSVLNTEVPGFGLDPTYLLSSVALGQELEFYRFAVNHPAREVVKNPKGKYLLEVRFTGEKHEANLLTSYGTFSQFLTNNSPKDAPNQLFLPCEPPVFFEEEMCQFRELITESSDKRESLLQDFLESNSQFIRALGFSSFRPQVHLIRQNIDGLSSKRANLYPDFIVEKSGMSGTALIELKRASAAMTAGPSDRRYLSANLNRSLAQLEDYYEFFLDSSNRQWFENAYGKEMASPELVLIMGHEDLATHPLQRILRTPIHNRPVHLLSYDDILNFVRAQHLVLPGPRT